MYVIALPPRHRRWLVVIMGILLLALVGHFAVGPDQHLPAVGQHHPLRESATADNLVALTFNLYWGEEAPGQVLDILEEREVQATFFVTGPWAQAHPDVARRIVDEGHQLGNGGYNYVSLTEYGRGFVREQIEKGDRALTEVTGVKPKVFRPPNGDYNDEILTIAREMGYTVVLWSVDSHDWMNPGADHILRQITDRTEPGSIIMLHANDPPGDTIAALDEIIDYLKDQDYRPATVEDLFSPDQ